MSDQLVERGANLLQIREQLLDLFGAQLGVYVLPSGATRIAFWITGGGKGPRCTAYAPLDGPPPRPADMPGQLVMFDAKGGV